VTASEARGEMSWFSMALFHLASTEEIADARADETDTAGAVAATSGSIHCKCKCRCECDEEDEESHTIINYKDLTISIYGKIPIGSDLVSLSIYEVRK